MSALLPAAMLLPLVAVPLIVLLDRYPNRREAVSLVTGGLLFALVVALVPDVAAGGRPAWTLAEPLPGIALAFEVEPLGLIMALVASFLWMVTTVYSIGYMRGHHEKHQTRFYAFFAIAIASTIGAAFAANLVTLFVFYEALTLSTFPLVTHAGTDEARRAGRTYLGVLIGSSIGLLLLAIAWTWNLTGSVTFTPGGILAGHATDGTVLVLYALFLFGIGKAALMPLHRWLPAAMVAPTPVSALLHAVAVVKIGVFSVLKVSIYIFGPALLTSSGAGMALAYVAATTILLGSLVAMRQDNLKRLLAYSTVSQLSYIVLGATLANAWGIVGGSLHIVMHAFGKITLFFCAGAILVASNKTRVSQLDGIGRRMPWTLGAFTVGALSMVGVPPLAGFVSKWYLLLGSITAEQYFVVAVIIVRPLLNAAYFVPIIYVAFFRPPASGVHGEREYGEAPLPMVAALVATAVLTVTLFFYPDWALALAEQLVGGP
ncbi:MAG: monovalent cation/H+ antiporter subunit D family protein [Gammaproteobacteria bacterium]|nr:MAG: monovalent cation/H+ antiporter subunit D family protein [Gammaproteobacteria bacterium]